jgi:uncharacterized protein with PQ loop repeat
MDSDGICRSVYARSIACKISTMLRATVLCRHNRTLAQQRIGLLASVATTAQFSSPLGALKRVVQTRSAAALSLTVSAANLVCSLLWFTYGYLFLNDVSTYQFLKLPCCTHIMIWT